MPVSAPVDGDGMESMPDSVGEAEVIPTPAPVDGGGMESMPDSVGEAEVIGNASAISSLQGFATLDDVGPLPHTGGRVQLGGVWIVAVASIVLGVVLGAPCIRDYMHVATQG